MSDSKKNNIHIVILLIILGLLVAYSVISPFWAFVTLVFAAIQEHSPPDSKPKGGGFLLSVLAIIGIFSVLDDD